MTKQDLVNDFIANPDTPSIPEANIMLVVEGIWPGLQRRFQEWQDSLGDGEEVQAAGKRFLEE